MSIRSTPVYRSPTTPLPNRQNLTSQQGCCICRCRSPSNTKKKPRHFDRSCSQSHREQRSGEICFSTHTFTQPTPCRRLCFFSISHKKTKSPVISTEAAHGLTVSGGAEKSASRPTPFTQPKPPSHLLLPSPGKFLLPSKPEQERTRRTPHPIVPSQAQPAYFFLTVFTEVTFTVGTTIGRRIGTSPTPGCCCCCIRVSISVRT
jgi:hypothetical protein